MNTHNVADFEKQSRASLAMAKEIFGDDFITPSQVGEIFNKKGIRVRVLEFSEDFKLPYSVQFLEEAAAAGCMMVYQPSNLKGQTIGLDDFAAMCKGVEPVGGGGPLLHTNQFDQGSGIVSSEAWFAAEKHRAHRDRQIIRPDVFRVATKSGIAGASVSSHYLFVEQIIIACRWVEKSFPISITQGMKDSIACIRKDGDKLNALQNSDPARFIEEIRGYSFFADYTETGLETLFRIIAFNQATGERLLRGTYWRNNVAVPESPHLGYSGSWDHCGLRLGAGNPARLDPLVALGFSCVGS